MLYLKRYIKFRLENNYVLLCNCSTITNYELPAKFSVLLNKLKQGYNPSSPIGIYSEKIVIKDLEKLGMLSKTKNSNEGFHNNNWVNLDYNESEFYK